MEFVIKKAERRQAKARIALCGPSGSGKTRSALELAKGIVSVVGGTIGLIDTERRSASLYADKADFVTIEMEPPYSPQRYMGAIDALERHGCSVVIIDQMSHAWSGEGGLLERVDKLKASAKNAISPWAKATPEQQQFIDRILRSQAHVIATMRVKTEWVLEEQQRGDRKVTVPRKIGLAPVQRDGIEYEFTTVLDLSADHLASASKDRTGLFPDDAAAAMIDESWGRRLAEWLSQGVEYQPEPPRPLPEGTYVKPADYVAPPDPPRAEKPSDVEQGFPVSDDQGPLIDDKKVKSFWTMVGQRAKKIGKIKEEIGRDVLDSFLIESTKLIPESLWSKVEEAIERYGK